MIADDRRRCAVCGASIAGRRSDATFCGGACRARASRQRRLNRDAEVTGASRAGTPSDPHAGAYEAHDAYRRALKRINARYRLVPPAACPDVNGPEWLAHDAAIEEAFAAGVADAVIKAVAAWERFAFEELTPGTAS